MLIVQLFVSLAAATSDGTRQGLDSMRGGVCATKGMKVVLKVGQSKSSSHESHLMNWLNAHLFIYLFLSIAHNEIT